MFQKIVNRSLLMFIVLFATTLPFPLHFFPSVGFLVSDFFQSINEFSATHIFGVDFKFISNIESDSLGLYIHCFHLLLFSIFLGFCWSKWFLRFSDNQILYFLQVSASYILAFFLLKYGVDKIFKVQFYFPEPNTLFTPLGYLSKDILFWSTVGSSYSYSLISGILEVIAAILLLHRKTRLLGAFVAFGVMLHVLIVNFSFDISVKILSSYLIILSLILISPYAKSLTAIFINQKNQFIRPTFENINPIKNRFQKLFKAILIAAMLFESLYFFAENNMYNDDLSPRPKFHGAYQVQSNFGLTSINSQTDSKYFGKIDSIKRIFIHRRGYLILQFQDEHFRDFPISFNENKNSWLVNFKNKQVEVHMHATKHNYFFTWEEIRLVDKKPIKLYFKLETFKIDLKKLPLSKPLFHWFVA